MKTLIIILIVIAFLLFVGFKMAQYTYYYDEIFRKEYKKRFKQNL